jgi:hypothetical protein
MAPRSTRRALQDPQALERYLRGSDPPRWMVRARDIDNGIEEAREELAQAYAALAAAIPDPARFAAAWRERLATWKFDRHVNELIRQHNEYYPIERMLPIDIRTGEYRLVNGKPYQRRPLDAEWAASEFPPEHAGGRPA